MAAQNCLAAGTQDHFCGNFPSKSPLLLEMDVLRAEKHFLFRPSDALRHQRDRYRGWKEGHLGLVGRGKPLRYLLGQIAGLM